MVFSIKYYKVDNYSLNKAAKVGEELSCPSCGTVFIKSSYQQVFCKSRGGTICKDKYWNTVTPQKRCNTTRISPASAKFMENRLQYIDYDYDDDPSWDAHKNSF